MNLSFTLKNFDTLRKFDETFRKKVGENTYVGTDSACVFVEYSPKLKAMLRPYPPEQNVDFVFHVFTCAKCSKNQVFMCVLSETTEVYKCDDCKAKEEAEKRKKQRSKE